MSRLCLFETHFEATPRGMLLFVMRNSRYKFEVDDIPQLSSGRQLCSNHTFLTKKSDSTRVVLMLCLSDEENQRTLCVSIERYCDSFILYSS